MSTSFPRAEVLAIGDELVHGNCIDTNSAFLASELAALGFEVWRISIASDDEDDLADAILAACARSAVVVATGGMGPTEDDRTRSAAARAAGVEQIFDPASWATIEARFGRAPPAPSNRRQAWLPAGARLLPNRWGTAPGFSVAIGTATFHALPGVPREMRGMWREVLAPELARWRLRPLRFHCLHVLGLPEADLGERLAGFMLAGAVPRVGITASRGLLTVRLVDDDGGRIEALAAILRARIGEHLVYEGDHGLADEVVHRLHATGITLAIAESCTGGMLGAALTGVPGSSAVLLAGYLPYGNAAKERDLAVSSALLAAEGAVSEVVAAAMAVGAATRAGARAGLSVTGIAGPSGGTADQPIGTVCFGLHLDGRTQTLERRFPDLGREFLRHRSVQEALWLLLRELPAG